MKKLNFLKVTMTEVITNQNHHSTSATIETPNSSTSRYPRLHLYVNGQKLRTFLSLLSAATKVADSIFLEPSHNALAVRAVPSNHAAHFLVVLDPITAFDGYKLGLPLLPTSVTPIPSAMPPPISYQPLHIRLPSKAVAATILRHPASVSRLDLYFDGTPSAIAPSVAAMIGGSSAKAGADNGGFPFACYGGDKMVVTTSTQANLRRTFTLNLQEGTPEKASVDGKQFTFECVAEPKLWAAYVGSLGSSGGSSSGPAGGSSLGSRSITVFPQGNRLLFRATMSLAEMGAYAAASEDGNGGSTQGGSKLPSTLGPVVSVDSSHFSGFSWYTNTGAGGAIPQSQVMANTPGKTIDPRPMKLFYHLSEVLGMRARMRFGGPGVPLFLDGIPKEVHAAQPIKHVSLLLAATDNLQHANGGGQSTAQQQQQQQAFQDRPAFQHEQAAYEEDPRAVSVPMVGDGRLSAHSPVGAPISILKRTSVVADNQRAYNPPPPLAGESAIAGTSMLSRDGLDEGVGEYVDTSADTLAGPSAFHSTHGSSFVLAGPSTAGPRQVVSGTQGSASHPTGPMGLAAHPRIAGLVSLSFGSPNTAISQLAGSKRPREASADGGDDARRGDSTVLARASMGASLVAQQNLSQLSSVVAETVYGDIGGSQASSRYSIARRSGALDDDDDEVEEVTVTNPTRFVSDVAAVPQMQPLYAPPKAQASQFEQILAGLVGAPVRSPQIAQAAQHMHASSNARHHSSTESPFDPNADTLVPMAAVRPPASRLPTPDQPTVHSATPDRTDGRESVEEFVPASDEKRYPPRSLGSGVLGSATSQYQRWVEGSVPMATGESSVVYSPSSTPKPSGAPTLSGDTVVAASAASVQLSGGTVVATNGSAQLVNDSQLAPHRALVDQYSQFIVSSEDEADEDSLTERFVQGATLGGT